MRHQRRSYLRASMENLAPDQPMISMEEQEILLTEAQQDLSDADETSRDVDRLEDVAEALEDVATVAERVEEASPEELVMVEGAMRMAVAGSDIDYEEVTPALESFVGKTISMEGAREMVAQLWEAIKAAVRKIYEKIEGFFYKIFATVPRLRRSIEDVRKRAMDNGSKSIKDNKTKLGREINSLTVDYKKTELGGSDLMAGMATLEEQTKYFLDTRANDISTLGNNLVKGLQNFDLQNGRVSLQQIVAAVGQHKWSKQPKFYDVTDSRFAKGEYVRMAPLPGGMSVFLRDGTISAANKDGDSSVLGDSEEVRRTSYSVQHTSPTAKQAEGGILNTLSTSDILKLLDQADAIVNHVEKYNRDSRWEKVKKVRKDLEKAADRLTADGQRDRDLTSAELDYYRSAIKFANFYARLSTQPMASLTSHSLKVVRATLVACNKSLSNYQ